MHMVHMRFVPRYSIHLMPGSGMVLSTVMGLPSSAGVYQQTKKHRFSTNPKLFSETGYCCSIDEIINEREQYELEN